MVVVARRRGTSALGLGAHLRHSPQLGASTTTQPSSIEEEGLFAPACERRGVTRLRVRARTHRRRGVLGPGIHLSKDRRVSQVRG